MEKSACGCGGTALGLLKMPITCERDGQCPAGARPSACAWRPRLAGPGQVFLELCPQVSVAFEGYQSSVFLLSQPTGPLSTEGSRGQDKPSFTSPSIDPGSRGHPGPFC
jgi:hypothetical protein